MTKMPTPVPPSFKQRYWPRFWPLFLLGMLGIASLPLTLVPTLRAGLLSDALPAMPLPALLALMLVNPILMLAAACAIGAALAPRTGLRALLAMTPDRRSLPQALRAAAPLAIVLGFALSLVTAGLDRALQPLMPDAWIAATAGSANEASWRATLMGLLYGGITEEILLRWGWMSLLAWAGWRLFDRRSAQPSAAVMWTAIVLAALLFGIGHLPAVAALAPLDAALIARTVALNAIGGILFGWLFWKRHLEAAMIAHASTHVGYALLRLAGLM